MRNIPLDEEDKELFSSYVNRTLCDVFRKNVAAFTQMWQEQGTSYWLKFCITLRSVLQKEGYPGLLVCSRFLPSYSEEFYIHLTKLLMGSNVDKVIEMVLDVIIISRYEQLMDNIEDVLLVTGGEPNPRCARLFFKSLKPMLKTEGLQVFCQLPLYLRAVGCLLKLLQRWLTAKPLTAKEKLFWKPPQNWHQKKHRQTNIFERYLQAEFGSSLSFLLNIQIADIAWWDETLFTKPVMSKEHHTVLGKFIDEECQRNDSLTIIHHQLDSYYLITSKPRGKLFNNKEAFMVAFTINLCRGLYFVDDLDAFHPYSQAYISFYHSSFGPEFWYGEDGVEKHFREMFVFHRDSVKNLVEVTWFIQSLRAIARNASSMNAHFYDSLHDGTTWTSAVTLIRLSWNMPLCINWMEVLLIKIYEFERYIKPLRHFPVKKELHNLLQKLFYVVEEAEFLAKAAIILAENIHQNQDFQPSMCYSLRKFLPDVAKKLANTMQFLEKDAYKILNVILKNGWSIEEQGSGENHSDDTSRVLVNLSAANSLPDIDHYFRKNFRSIYYWMGNEEIPDIQSGGKNAVKVAKLIEDLKTKSARENNKRSDYDFAAFKRSVQGIKGIPGCEPQVFMIDLLVEDGWISNAKEKVSHYKQFNNVTEELLSTQDFKHFSAAYFIVAYFLGEFKDCSISGQNALARLHRAECLAIMSDSGLKLSSMVQNHSSRQPIPPSRFFKDAFKEISSRCADIDLTLVDAARLLQRVEQVKSTNLNTSCKESLTDMCVPTEVELIDPAVRARWLECFEKKRIQLLQLVSEEQFRITQACQEKKNAVSRRCFPLNDVLEFRLVEEAAALRKTLEMDLETISVHNLVKLLAYRLNWLQNAYFAWQKEKNSWEQRNRPQQFTYEHMKKINKKNFKSIQAAKLHLSAIFNTLISKFGTTHPVCEITLNQMCNEAKTAYSLCFTYSDLPILGSGMRYWDYCNSVSKMSAYCKQLILHCNEVWNVPLFNCEPQMEVHFGSAAHAEWIITVFQKFYLLVIWKNFTPNETVIIPTAVNAAVTKSMVTAMSLMTVLIAYPQEHLNTITQLKATLKEIWFHLVNIKQHLTLAEDFIMEFLGDKHSRWAELLKIFSSNNHNNVLVKIAFSEFISASESEWNKRIKQKARMEKEIKVTGTVHSECQVSANKKVIISDDTNKHHMDQEHKVTLKEEKGKFMLQESKVAVKEGKLAAISHVTQPIHQKCKEKKVDEKGKSMLQESKVAVREEELSAVTDKKDIDYVDPETRVIKEEKVIGSTNEKNEHTQVGSKYLDEAINQKGSAITVGDKDESCANKELQITKGNSSKVKVCNFCKKVVKNQRTVKKCSLCKKEKWEKGRYFCSEACEANEWIEMHREAHKPK